MKKFALIAICMMLLSSCGQNEYLKTIPVKGKDTYSFQGFKWSPDGLHAAVYTDDLLYIITPDGGQTAEPVRISKLQYDKSEWNRIDGEWKFDFDEPKEQIQPGNYEAGHDSANSNNLDKNNEAAYQYFYEEFKTDQERGIYLNYTGKFFEVIRVDLKETKYATLFNSSHILYGLNYFNGNVYFIGVNPRDDMNKYILYKIEKDRVEKVSIKSDIRRR